MTGALSKVLPLPLVASADIRFAAALRIVIEPSAFSKANVKNLPLRERIKDLTASFWIDSCVVITDTIIHK